MRIQLFLTAIFCGVLVQSCGGDPLVGDWFACRDAACNRLDDDGIRFTEMGEVALLEAPGSGYDPDVAYRAQRVGSYDFRDGILTITSSENGETASLRAELDGDQLLLYLKTASAACISAPGGATKCKSDAPSTEPVRLRLVHSHGCAGPPPSDPPHPTTPTPAPSPPPSVPPQKAPRK